MVELVAVRTYTVVFLHRFPKTITDAELSSKVLSLKKTKSHRGLAGAVS
jgi:hypothetical protein